ncbi:MAG: PAS domain S-box protein [Opitutaceae bacterium]|jgi:PAS domain S-box-containing protein
MKRIPLSEPVRLALKYAGIAAVWIVGSDIALNWAEDESSLRAGWSMIKGLAFVAITAAILYALARRMQSRIRKTEEAQQAKLRETNEHLQRAKGLHAALTRANKAALTAQEEHTLFNEIGAALVSLAGLRFVWFSWVDENIRAIKPVSWAGDAPGHVEGMTWTVSPDDVDGQGPSGRSIRENRIVVIQDMLSDETLRPWHEQIKLRGFRSCASVPFGAQGRRGLFSVYAGEPGFFSREITDLMDELAADLVHGLELIASRAERARLDDRLRESETRYRALFENDAVVMLVVDPANGNIEDANPAAVRYYGWDRATLTRKKVSDLNHVPDEELVRTMQAILAGRLFNLKRRHNRADGSVRDVTIFPIAVRIEGRDMLYSIIHDVTEKQEALKRLHLLQTAIEAAPSGIVIADALGHIEWVNPAFTTITGYDLSMVTGHTPSILKSGRQGPAFYTNLWNTISHGQVWSGDLQNQRRDGAIYWEHMVIAPVINPTGTIEHYVAIKQDISDQKTMENQVARTQRLESIGLLAGGIAHDLNNVLAPILMAMDLFKLRYPDPADQARLEIVRKSAERGAGIVRQVLTFARGVDGERMSLRPEHLVKEVRNLLAETLPRHIEIVMAIDRDLPAIIGDPTQLHQVLLNLGVNARDAMPQGGVLTFGARREHFDEQRITQSGLTVAAGDHVVLFVRDTGSGITPEVLEHIFEPFYTTKPRGEGTGLGLSTVLGIVRGHGGGLDVLSRPGKGTEFRVLLPVTTTPGSRTPFAGHRDSVEGAGRAILVVDDEEPIRAVTGMALELHGFKHVDAADGRTALDIFEREPDRFAAVILDHMMPRLGGEEVAARIKELRPKLPIILISGVLSQSKTGSAATDAYLRNGDLVLKKPFSHEDLLAALAKVLNPKPDEKAAT